MKTSELKQEFKNIEGVAQDAIREVNSMPLKENYFPLLEADAPTQQEMNQNNKKNEKKAIDASREQLEKKVQTEKNIQNVDKKDFTGQSIKMSQQQKDDKIAKYRLYIKVCQQVLGAKMEIIEEKYKIYMTLLKSIVKVEEVGKIGKEKTTEETVKGKVTGQKKSAKTKMDSILKIPKDVKEAKKQKEKNQEQVMKLKEKYDDSKNQKEKNKLKNQIDFHTKINDLLDRIINTNGRQEAIKQFENFLNKQDYKDWVNVERKIRERPIGAK